MFSKFKKCFILIRKKKYWDNSQTCFLKRDTVQKHSKTSQKLTNQLSNYLWLKANQSLSLKLIRVQAAKVSNIAHAGWCSHAFTFKKLCTHIITQFFSNVFKNIKHSNLTCCLTIFIPQNHLAHQSVTNLETKE